MGSRRLVSRPIPLVDHLYAPFDIQMTGILNEKLMR